jgi:leucyl-tRNA synthetase
MAYQPAVIEPKWQKAWQKAKTFRTGEDTSKPKFYALDMFPYPSAAGLHVGHPLGYTATDIISRFWRQKGCNVLHPMGWDAFGLPAEQHAIDTSEHPAKLTYRNTDTFRRQLQRLGFSYDWEREISTCDPDYYKWTQKIFSLLYEKGLAYQAEVSVNWCPALKTVLANEEVIDGKSERGNHPVYRVPRRQWMLRITSYAERLLSGIETLDWPESVKDIQRNWIGKSVGARVSFSVADHMPEAIEIFTTRPDTLYGVTYMVLAPEHPLVSKITIPNRRESIKAYQEAASRKSDMDRTELAKDKSGEATGAFAVHPLTGAKIPIYVSDYVMMTYGTGAIMAVPAHDERDHAFAKKFGLSIVQVVSPTQSKTPLDIQSEAYTGDGALINSPLINGLNVEKAKETILAHLESKGLGEKSITYKLRDWLFSRQRYWGEPIPVLKNGSGATVRAFRDDELPLMLPEVESYEPTDDGKSPLAALSSWVERVDSKGNTLYTETDTMPGSAGSSWYFLRFCDPLNKAAMFSYEKAKYWMPVDLYVGGQEHAVGHLLYSRFWTKVLFDAGLCPVDEPFKKLVNQGMICRDGAKMSKSKGNGVSPDDVIRDYGADTLRVYEMFMGPFTQTKDWQDSNLAGVLRFLNRVERMCVDDNGVGLLTDAAPLQNELRLLHKTIKKITEDMAAMSFNTSVAQMMIFVNGMYESGCRSKSIIKEFLILLSPYAPHLAEELWQKAVLDGKSDVDKPGYPFVSLAQWPSYDPALVTDDEVRMGVQVNGKHRGEIVIPAGASQEIAVNAALESESLRAAMEGKTLRKTIYVPGRILNFVVS